MRVEDILEALYHSSFGPQDQREAREWMKGVLEGDYLIFDEKSDVRKWALDNTDLVEPKEEAL